METLHLMYTDDIWTEVEKFLRPESGTACWLCGQVCTSSR